MRVISGTHRGRRLVCPRGLATRPTADRIKESLFNILGPGITGLRVLDLFAGTGALGIEALSRGAVRAVFIDKAPAALAAIRRNLGDLGLDAQGRVVSGDIGRSLDGLAGEAPFDLVFMDPPYGIGAVTPALERLIKGAHLAAGARIVVEHDRREPVQLPEAPLQFSDQRRYGKTLVSFIKSVL